MTHHPAPRRTVRRTVLLTTVVLAGLAVAATVWAAWSASALGSAVGHAAQMPGGPQPSATVVDGSVTVAWPTVQVAGRDVAGYRVSRYDAESGAVAPIGAGCDATTAQPTCTELEVPGGDWQYAVTPVQHGWSGARSALSEPVRVVRGVTLSLSPSEAAPGATTTASGAGFRPEEVVEVRAGGHLLASVTADLDGVLAPTAMTVPALPHGPVVVEARGTESDRTAVATLDVRALLSVAPGSSRGGLAVTLDAVGLPADEPVVVLGATTTTSARTDATGTVSSSVRLPLRPAGAHQITVTAGGVSAATTIAVVPGLTVSTTAIAAGDTLTVSADGLAAGADVVLQLGGGPSVTARADAAGTLAPTDYPVPAATPAGPAELTVDDGAGTVLRSTVQVSAVRLILAETAGAPGTAVSLSGTGWPAGPLAVTFGGVELCRPTAGADGTFQASCTVPERRAGDYPVRAVAGTVVAEAGSFTVLPRVTPTSSTSSPGGSVTVDVAGFAANSVLTADLSGRPLALTASTSSFGSARFTVTLPADAAPGPQPFRVRDAAGNEATTPLTLLGATLTLTPTSGVPGEVVRVSGAGWSAGGSPVTVRIGDYQLCTPTPDASGGFAVDCALPDLPAGQRATIGTRGAVSAEAAAFTVRPTLRLTPATASPGTTVSVTGRGFTANTTLTGLSFDSQPVAVAAKTTSHLGSFEGLTFVVPAGTAAGDHVVEVTDAAGQKAQAALIAVAPQITLAATSGAVNTRFGVTGSGWPASSSVTVSVGGAPACTVTTDAAGTLATSSCQVPLVPGGPQPVVARAGGATSSPSSFDVLPTFTLNARNVSPGSSVAVTAYGLPAASPVQVTIGGSGAGAITAGSNGFASASVTVPDLPAGSQVVRVPGAAGHVAEGTVTLFRPTLTSSVHEVVPGRTSVQLTGAGWPASAGVTPKVGSFEICSQGFARADGTLSITCTAKSLAGGPGQQLIGTSALVIARDPQSVTVLPGLTLSPTSGLAGTSTRVTAEGLRPGPVSLTFGGAVVASGSASAAGYWASTVVVPAGASPGAHQVAVVQAGAPSASATYTVTAPAAVAPVAQPGEDLAATAGPPPASGEPQEGLAVPALGAALPVGLIALRRVRRGSRGGRHAVGVARTHLAPEV